MGGIIRKADENILNLVETLKVPLYRYVIDLVKFRELQVAFMKGGVMNLEAITDHLLFGDYLRSCGKYNLK